MSHLSIFSTDKHLTHFSTDAISDSDFKSSEFRTPSNCKQTLDHVFESLSVHKGSGRKEISCEQKCKCDLFVLYRSTQIKTYSWDNAQVVLAGNKCDMEEERVVSVESGRLLAEQLGRSSNNI